MAEKKDLTLKTYLTVDFSYAERVRFDDRSIGEFMHYLGEHGNFIKDAKGTWHNKECILKFRREEISEERDDIAGHPIHHEIVQ